MQTNTISTNFSLEYTIITKPTFKSSTLNSCETGTDILYAGVLLQCKTSQFKKLSNNFPTSN